MVAIKNSQASGGRGKSPRSATGTRLPNRYVDVDINFELSSSSDDNFSELERTASVPLDVSKVDLSKYVNRIHDKTPRLARRIRLNKPALGRILRQRRQGGDYSDSYSDDFDSDGDNSESGAYSNDVFDLSSDDNFSGLERTSSVPLDVSKVDLSKYVNRIHDKTPRLARRIRLNKPALGRILRQRRQGGDYSDSYSDDFDSDELYGSRDGDNSESGAYSNDDFDLSSDSDDSNASSDEDEQYNELQLAASNVVRIMKSSAPKLVRMIRSNKSKWNRSELIDTNVDKTVSDQRSSAAADMSRMYVEDVLASFIRSHQPGLVHSDVKDDVALAQQDKLQDNREERLSMSRVSVGESSRADSGESSDISDIGESEDSEIVINYQQTNSNVERKSLTDDERTAAKERIVTAMFTKPKQGFKLSQRIRQKRDIIQQVSLKRRAQGIEDTFVLSTEARRASIFAHQARAHRKLQKRIAQRNTVAIPSITGEDTSPPLVALKERDEESSVGEDSGGSAKRTSTPRNLNKLSSFEVFNEKKEMVKNYTAHQSLRNQTLETQRLKAKEALMARRSGRAKKR
jgi:hypothetical protein